MKISEIKDLNEAFVFISDTLAGKISRTNHGSTFEYNNAFLDYAKDKSIQGIAFSLPVLKQSYISQGTNLHPFFANLLPEGRRLQALGKVAKTSLDDLFTLILAGGTNCVGDIFVSAKNTLEPQSAPTSKEDLSKISFWELFEESILGEDYDRRSKDITISGVYPKISAGMISFPLKYKKSKSEYILKLEPKEYPCLVANECFFMNLASDCGIEVPSVKIVYDKNSEPGLLVERFDRRFSKNEKKIKRIHQEDACQLLNIYPSEKYRVSMREIAEALEKVCSSPIIEISKLVRLYLYSYFIGNGDLHAKNISIIEDRDRVTLSPAYDLLSTIPYGDRDMALQLEGKRNNIRYKDILSFSKRHGLLPSALDNIIEELKGKVFQAKSKFHLIGLEDKKTEFLIKLTGERIDKL